MSRISRATALGAALLCAAALAAPSTVVHQGGMPSQQTWFGPDGTPYTVNPTYD